MKQFVMAWCCLLASATTAPAQNFQIDINQFDSWIFSGMGDAKLAREKLADRAEMEIDRIGFSTSLLDSQIAKLRFAAKGDIKRFYDDVEEAHRQFHTMQEAGKIGQENINDVYQLASPLAQRLNAGIFDEESLLKKVARVCVVGEQAERLRARQKRQIKLQSDAAITLFVATLGRRLPMTQVQRETLMEIAMTNITLPDPTHQYAQYLLMYELSELPQGKLKEIFDETQYQTLKKVYTQGLGMKANLKRMGMLDDE
ncbi:hypothetical protein [Allorhodopirellula solitaria]|uniref:Uncharacterized protein n=1 Tax=Allorhodopirellula solitaria TaxID=2527987 RepID=A0A5C5X1M3_9BACT|nr:hypothetical protein [Allorhodopirellula solitaria]TWT56055.1 hypothetical protein CA85_46470 [Allorhodopirellula solitaria]